MVLRKLIFNIGFLLAPTVAIAGANLGTAPGVQINGQLYNKTFVDVYENISGPNYLNVYAELLDMGSFNQTFRKIDLNRHYDKFVLGVGTSNTVNQYGNFQDVHVNLVMKLW